MPARPPEPPVDAPAVAGVDLELRKGEPQVIEVVTLPALLDLARAAGRQVKHVLTREATLEDVFVHLTGSGLRDG